MGVPPAIVRASGSCPLTAGQWTFVTHVTDDYGVATVTLRYATAAGQATLGMSGPAGATSGDWTLSMAPVAGASGFTVIATDAAGQQVSAGVSGNCG